MLEAHVRSKLQPWFDYLGFLLFQKVTPNTITLCALMCGIASGVAIACHSFHIALCLLWLSGLCDVMDGTVARLFDKKQAIGAYIDLISDRMVEGAIIIGFAIASPQHYLAYICFLVALLLHFSTFLAAGILLKNSGNKSMHHDHSFVERAEAFLVFSVILLCPSYLFQILILFSSVIFLDGCARFKRVVYSHTSIASTSNNRSTSLDSL